MHIKSLAKSSRNYKLSLIALLILLAWGALASLEYTSLAADTGNNSFDTQLPEIDNTSIVNDSIKTGIIEELQQTVDLWSSQLPVDSAVIIQDLSTNQAVVVNADDSFTTASIYKLFVAYELYQQGHTNPELLSTELSNGYTAAQCIEPMIVYSDNTCGYLLGWLLGWENINQTLEQMGLANTNTNNYINNEEFNGNKVTTAKDVSEFLQTMQNNDNILHESTKKIFEFMLAQQINDRIPTSIPDGLEIAHKTGNLDGSVHDVGYIVTENETYSYVILTSGWLDELDGSSAINELMEQFVYTISAG